MEPIKISDTEIGIPNAPTVYTKDYIDQRVANYDLSITNLQSESQKWRDLQASAVELGVQNSPEIENTDE